MSSSVVCMPFTADDPIPAAEELEVLPIWGHDKADYCEQKVKRLSPMLRMQWLHTAFWALRQYQDKAASCQSVYSKPWRLHLYKLHLEHQ